MLTSLRLRVAVTIALTMVIAAAVTLGFVAIELSEIAARQTPGPAHVEYGELLLTLAPFALLAPLVGGAVAGWSLRPLARAAAELGSIGPERPELRIATAGLPAEALPFVAAANGALDRLAAALANERRLAADAAHALRTPLATARLRVARAREGGAIDLDGLAGDLDRLRRSVDQILAVARLETTRAATAGGVDLARAARAVAVEFLPIADATGRELVVDTDEPAPRAACDEDDLREALRNLVHNAFQHGTGTVSVKLDSEGESARITVEDEGPGVPPDQRDAMLARFGRGAASTGSGLGLTIAADAAKRSGGALRWTGAARLELLLPIA